MNGSATGNAHGFRLHQRKEMEIEGVTEVISFDETSVILRTLCGEMSVEGSDMKIGTLDTDRGVVALSGRVDAVYYSADTADEKKSGFFGKLFR